MLINSPVSRDLSSLMFNVQTKNRNIKYLSLPDQYCATPDTKLAYPVVSTLPIFLSFVLCSDTRKRSFYLMVNRPRIRFTNVARNSLQNTVLLLHVLIGNGM